MYNMSDGNFTLSLMNLFKGIAVLSPYIIGFVMVMLSVFNQDLKGLFYLMFAILTLGINILLSNSFNNESSKPPSTCHSLINMPFSSSFYNRPALTSVFLSFTAIYVIMPMLQSHQINISFIVFMSLLWMLDVVHMLTSQCSDYVGVLFGTASGSLFGVLWYYLLHVTGYDSLLYFNTMSSNKLYCSRPTKQTYKCSVYKNGELLTTT